MLKFFITCFRCKDKPETKEATAINIYKEVYSEEHNVSFGPEHSKDIEAASYEKIERKDN